MKDVEKIQMVDLISKLSNKLKEKSDLEYRKMARENCKLSNKLKEKTNEVNYWKRTAANCAMLAIELDKQLKDLQKQNQVNDMVLKVSNRIGEWLDKPYEGSEEEDRIEFAKELTAFIKQELQQT